MKRFAALVMCILCLFQTALAETSVWTCLDCGDEEQGCAFCVFCGAERPKECPACGWKTFLLAYDSNICDIDFLSLGAVFIPSNHDRKYLGTGIENFELAPPTEYALSRSIRACDYYWEHGGTTRMNMPTGDGCFYHQEMTELYGVRPACWLSLEALQN